MENNIKAIRGMNDILPTESAYWQFAEQTMRDVLQSFGFQEIRFPILEKTELFQRTIGEATDIVEKEMYTFTDRNNEMLTLRPEGTAGCVRAGIEHGLFYHQIQKLWYLGPNFRYERPQKGRYRQFYQLGVEVFGIEGPDIDAELISTVAKIYEKLGLKNYLELEINSIGSRDARAIYKKYLVDHFTKHFSDLDEDSKRRLTSNPLRILDSKNPSMQHLIENAPKMLDYLDSKSEQHFLKLQEFLQALGIPFRINPRLVRGLDYYNRTVFEWVTHELGAQGTVCGGGRYDGLVAELGGPATEAVGYAMGIERTILLLQQHSKKIAYHPHIYIISDGEETLKKSFILADQLRHTFKNARVLVHSGGGTLKNQFKKADKSGAILALILGENELKENKVSIKFLREEGQQMTVNEKELLAYLDQHLKI